MRMALIEAGTSITKKTCSIFYTGVIDPVGTWSEHQNSSGYPIRKRYHIKGAGISGRHDSRRATKKGRARKPPTRPSCIRCTDTKHEGTLTRIQHEGATQRDGTGTHTKRGTNTQRDGHRTCHDTSQKKPGIYKARAAAKPSRPRNYHTEPRRIFTTLQRLKYKITETFERFGRLRSRS